MSDRVFGLVITILALAYIASAYQLQTPFLSDPVGPKTFPYIVGGVIVISGLTVMFRPDEDPVWPGAMTFAKIGIAIVVMVAYAYALRPLGFLVPTAIASGVLSYQLSPRAGAAALTGVGLSIVLFVVFKYLLGLETLVPFPKSLG